MAKYSGSKTRPKKAAKKAAVRTKKTQDGSLTTYEGDTGFKRSKKSELFVLAVNFMGEQEGTFYESGDARQARFVDLVHAVTNKDPEWMKGFIPYLRKEAFMRTASVVAAAEYVKAGGPNGAALIDSALLRPDEPMELMGYWFEKHGRNLPMPVKRGLARALRRMVNEKNALKYDGTSRGIRMGDVIELAHPKKDADWQGDLYEYLLDRRHHPDAIGVEFANLPKIAKWRELQALDRGERRAYLREHGGQVLDNAGITWEVMSEWLPEFGDAESWEAMIPQMGLMALIRNLRNFDEAGVSDAVAGDIARKLSDPEHVHRSMMFPYRFYSAYREVPSTRWAHALDKALDASTDNIPVLGGRSLVLVDVSASMGNTLSNRSKVRNYEAGALFGIAQFRRAGFEGNLVAFGSYSEEVKLSKGTSVLKGLDTFLKLAESGKVGHGTETWAALSKHYDNHDRVFIFTDMQSFPAGGWAGGFTRATKDDVLDRVKGPIYNWNLAGYRATNMEVGRDNRYEMAGLSDATFRQIALLEAAQDAKWPWQ